MNTRRWRTAVGSACGGGLAAFGTLMVSLVTTLGCGASGERAQEPASAVSGSDARPTSFAFVSTQGEPFSSRSTEGLATAVLFVTTYDLASQVEAKRLEEVVHYQRPPANAGAVVLESEEYAVLADAFRTSLGLSYPVCLADEATLSEKGPFGKVDRVPTLVVLDRSGVEIWRREGLATRGEIQKALARASRRGSPFAP
jgi:hypothetical protein